MQGAVLHRGKDLAVALPRRRGIHLDATIARITEMLSPFGSSVTVRTSHIAVYRRYLLPSCFLGWHECRLPLSRPEAGVRTFLTLPSLAAQQSAIVWQDRKKHTIVWHD